MDLETRRWVSRLVQAGLIVIIVLFIGSWFFRRGASRIVRSADNVRVQREPVAEASLGPGDMRIYNSDSTVDLILKGNQVLAGLSPKMIAKIRGEMDKSPTKDTSGLGGMIAQTVKQTVASTIGMHVVYPVSEIRDIRFEDGSIIIDKQGGGETRLFSNTKVDKNGTKGFPEADAQRFIAAVKARKMFESR
jgi:hypothetical protein